MPYSTYDYNIASLPRNLLRTANGVNPLPGQFNHYTATGDIDGRFPSGMGTGSGRNSSLTSGNVIYNSYAGVDIVASVILPGEEPLEIGELQTISYSIHRENIPVRTLGHVSPVNFTKGGRTIAGSMIFTVFNNYAFYRLRQYQAALENNLYPVADMLPPLDFVLTFASESGVFSKMKIYGVTFVDEGGTMSVDDLITEQTFSYMARGIQPMTGYVLPE